MDNPRIESFLKGNEEGKRRNYLLSANSLTPENSKSTTYSTSAIRETIQKSV